MLVSVGILFLAAVSSVSAVAFHYSDCNTDPSKVLHLTDAHIRPYPIHIPGSETGDINLQILQPISGNHYKLDVSIKTHVFILGYIGVPCINNVGSCSYDVCDLLSGFTYPNGTSHCPIQIQSTTPNFPCSCPFAAGTYHLNPSAFAIPELSGIWTWLAKGDYKLKGTITDTQTGHQVACYTAELTIEGDCSGFSCFIG